MARFARALVLCSGVKEGEDMALREGIIEVLDKAQTSTAHHTKLLKTLRSLFDGTEQADEFVEALVDPLRAALVIVRKEAAVERVLDFVAKFAASVAPLETAEEEEDDDEEGVTSEYNNMRRWQLLTSVIDRAVLPARFRRREGK